MRIIPLLVSGLALAVSLDANLAAQRASIAEFSHPQKVDSGWIDNGTNQPRVVFKHDVQVPGAPWMRIFFDQTNLPQGSFLRMTSLADKDVQTLDGRSLATYGNASCYLNGEAIRVELVAGPNTKANRVYIVDSVSGATAAPQSICGGTDDRVQSFNKKQGRHSTGCTGWLFGVDAMGTAGHCMNTSSTYILEFNVPRSRSNGDLVRAKASDQYPTIPRTARRLSGRVGEDWGVSKLGRNSQTGRLPGDVQGGWYDIGPIPATTQGQSIRITGYGTSSIRVLNQVQKTHVGPLSQIGSNFLRYRTDTTGGNSGSPIVHINTGKLVGVHTHGGCSSPNANFSNQGTRVDRADFQAAIKSLIGRPGAVAYYGAGCRGSAGVPTHRIVGAPQIDSTSTFTTTNLPRSAAGFLLIGGRQLDIDLTPFGFAGCRQLTSNSVVAPLRSNGNGDASLAIRVPNCTILVGGVGYTQHVGIDAARNTAVFSNGARLTIGYQ